MRFFQEYQRSNVKKKEHEEICLNMQLEFFREGEPVIHYGEQAEKFYIILKGGCSVFLPKDGESLKNEIDESNPSHTSPSHRFTRKRTKENFELTFSVASLKESCSGETVFGGIPEEKLDHKDHRLFHESTGIFKHVFGGILPSGTSFGEIGLIKRQTRGATVIANEDTYLGVITRAVFDKTIKHGENLKLQKKIDFFMEMFFQNCTRDTAMRVCLYFKPVEIPKGHVVCREGESPEFVYFIKKGLLSFSKLLDKRQVDFTGEEEENGKVDPNKSRIIIMEAKKLYNWPSPVKFSQECLFTKGPMEIVGDLDILTNRKSEHTVAVHSLKFKAYAITKANFLHIFNFYPSINIFFNARRPLAKKKKAIEEKTISNKKKQLPIKTASLVSAEIFLKSKKKAAEEEDAKMASARRGNGHKETLKGGTGLPRTQEKARNISDINGLHKIENITESNQKKLSFINKSKEIVKSQSFSEMFKGSSSNEKMLLFRLARNSKKFLNQSSGFFGNSNTAETQPRSPTLQQFKENAQKKRNFWRNNSMLISVEKKQPSQFWLTNPSTLTFSLKARVRIPSGNNWTPLPSSPVSGLLSNKLTSKRSIDFSNMWRGSSNRLGRSSSTGEGNQAIQPITN